MNANLLLNVTAPPCSKWKFGYVVQLTVSPRKRFTVTLGRETAILKAIGSDYTPSINLKISGLAV